MKKMFIPFENLKYQKRILMFWLFLIILTWSSQSFLDHKNFPEIQNVIIGFKKLYMSGLIVHLFSSIFLCIKSILIAVLISLLFAYSFFIPFFKPLSIIFTKLRYLPLTGINFYATMLLSSGRSIQVFILVTFISTYLLTSLVSLFQSIIDEGEEIDHAKTLGCTRWEILYEVIIKGKIDHVIEIVRQNLSIAWMMLVTVESTLASAGGLGFLIRNSDKMFDHSGLVALQLIILFIGITSDYILVYFRKAMFRYSDY